MRANQLIFLMLLSSLRALGQQGINIECISSFDSLSGRVIYSKANAMPEYIGGTVELLRYFQKFYRQPSDPNDFQGSFHFEFVVEIDGTVSGIRIRNKNLKEKTPAEKEALRVLKNMPKWIPGRCDNELVPVKIQLPIKF